MEATLKFHLPEERQEHLFALHGARIRFALDAFGTFLRRFDKHREPLPPAAQSILEEIRECWREQTSDLPEVE